MKASRVVRALYGRNGLFKARLTALRPAGAGIPSASPRRAAFSSEAYAGRITNVMGRIATLQDVLDEKSPTWRELVRRTSQSVADAPLKLLVVGEDYSGKSFVIRALLDDDTVDANTSSFLAKSLGDLAAPTRVVFGDKPSLEPAAASSPFALMNVPTQWLKYCNVEIIYLPGLYSFDFGGNKQILDLSLLEADAALLVTDVSRQLMGSREIAIMQRLQKMGKGDRIVAVVNQTDRLDNEAVQVTRLSKEIPQRARTYAPSFSSPVFFTAAKRALVGDIHGAPIDPTCYQRRMAAAGIDSLREHLLGNVLKPANHVAAKYITNLGW